MQNPQFHDLGPYWTTTYIDADGVQYTSTTDSSPIEIDDRYPHNIEADSLEVHEAYDMCSVGLNFEYTYPYHPHFTISEALSLQPSLQSSLNSPLEESSLTASDSTIRDERKPVMKLEKTPKIIPTSVSDPEIPLPEEPATSTKTRVSRKTRLRRRVPARFKCAAEDCPRSFSRLFDAQRHHRETHLDERMWICDDADKAVQKIGMNGCKVEEGGCRKKFKRSSHLRAHLRVAGQYKRAGTFDSPVKALTLDNTYQQAPVTVHIHGSYPEGSSF